MLKFWKLPPGATAGIVVILVLIIGSSIVVATREPAPLCRSTHGVYVGAAAPSNVISFERWSGAPVGCDEDFLSSDNWSDISEPTWWITRWAASPERLPLVLSVPLLPNSGADLRTGAEGKYDQYFRTLATLLVREGFSNATIRLGWEFNGGEFPWAVHPGCGPNSTASAGDFIQYWRNVVLTMRSVAGSSFSFNWNVNNGDSAMPAEQAYPGDDFVDGIGIDAYDQVWGPNGAQVMDPVQRWRAIADGRHNLNWWAAFARLHRKKLSLPEWGVINGGHGGGDNPYYVRQILMWARKNNVVFDIYFDAEQSVISSGSFPRAAAAYIADISRQ